MFGKPVSDEGCGKWLSTKTTRKIAQSFKNTAGSKKGKRKPVIFKNDHIPGAAISSTPMSSQELEMLSRAKQSKMDHFFKPVACKAPQNKVVLSDDGLELESINQERSDSVTISRKHQMLTSDLEEFPAWEDYSYPYNENSAENNSFPRASAIKQNKNELYNTSILHVPREDPLKLHSDNEHPDDNINSSTPTTPNGQETLPSQDEPINSPTAKRFKNMSEEYPTISNKYSEMDSGSFQYTQWVKDQVNKSKDLYKYFLIDDKNDSVTTCPKYSAMSHEKSDIFKSKFLFTEWGNEQKENCKKLHECMRSRHSGESEGFGDQEITLNEKNENALETENTLMESNFRFTEWVGEQKSRCADVHKSFHVPESKNSQTVYNPEREKTCTKSEINCIPESENIEAGYNSGKNSLGDSEILCIPETEIFDFEDKSPKSEDLNSKFEPENNKTNVQQKVINMRLSPETALKDVSNLYEERKTKNNSKNMSNKYNKIRANTVVSQESEPFQFTEWVQNQHQISKQIQKEPPTDDKFWESPVIKNTNHIKCCSTVNKRPGIIILASDTDQESDTEGSNFSL